MSSAAAASASAASSASATDATVDAPSGTNNGGDPPSNNGGSNNSGSGEGDSPRLAEIKADPRNVSVTTGADGMTRITRVYGPNQVEFTVDPDGFTRSAHFEINQSYSGLSRSAGGEPGAQARGAARGVTGDQGGHMVGHRFTFHQGDINQFPQAGQFNNSAYRTMENELEGWVNNGYQVEGRVTVNQTGGARPDRVEVEYVVTDPATGDVVHYHSVETNGQVGFENQAGQTFDRVPNADIPNSDVLFEGRPAADPPATNPPSAAPPAG